MDHEVRLTEPWVVEICSAATVLSGLSSRHLLRQANEHVFEVHKLAIREVVDVNSQIRWAHARDGQTTQARTPTIPLTRET